MTTDDDDDDYKVQQEVTIENPDLPITYFANLQF